MFSQVVEVLGVNQFMSGKCDLLQGAARLCLFFFFFPAC